MKKFLLILFPIYLLAYPDIPNRNSSNMFECSVIPDGVYYAVSPQNETVLITFIGTFIPNSITPTYFNIPSFPDNTVSYIHCKIADIGYSYKVTYLPDNCPDSNQVYDNFGNCVSSCPSGMIQNPDGSCRCPYNSVPDENGSCTICEPPFFPNSDDTSCVNCGNGEVPIFGNSCGIPCSEDAPFYYPVTENCSLTIVIPASGSSRNCYSCSDVSGGTVSPNNPQQPNQQPTDGNDIPDINNSAPVTPVDDFNISKPEYNINFPDYNPAFEAIGDKQTDTTNAIDRMRTEQNNKLDKINDNLDQVKQNTKDTNDKLDEISDKLDVNGSLPDFSSMTSQIEGIFDTFQTSFDTTKQTFLNIRNIIDGDSSVTIPQGNFNGFELAVWDKTINVNPCPMFSNIHPFMTLLINFSFLILSFYILFWGFKP